MRARGRTRRLRLLAWILPGLALLGGTGLPAASRAAAPVLCTVILSAGTTDSFDCVRQDTDAGFAAVPEGLYLHVTDLQIARNNLATSGEFFATIGRESGFILPGEPRITTSGTPLEFPSLHFETPAIVLEEGELLAARNDGSSDFPINIYASGVLTPSVFLPEPAASALLAAGAAAVSLLAAARRRARSG